jgi:hypothetical protein
MWIVVSSNMPVIRFSKKDSGKVKAHETDVGKLHT